MRAHQLVTDQRLLEFARNQVALRSAGEEVDAVQELLDTPAMPESPHPRALPATTDLVFDDVHFGYTAGAPILRGACARIPANAMTAIVGASGSGKTTMLRLISRFWDFARAPSRWATWTCGGFRSTSCTSPCR